MPGFNAVGAHAVGSIFAGAVNILPERWSEPTAALNVRRRLTAACLAPFIAFAPFVGAPPETITVDKWFKELSTPVRFPPALKRSLQQATAYVNATPVTDSIEARWHYPWSEPVRFKQSLGAPRQQAFFAEPSGMTVPETVLYSKFAYQWSEPVRFKPSLRTGLHQFLALHPTPSPFVASGWFNWLTEPVRVKPRLRTGLNQTAAFNPLPFVSYGWNQRLSEPVKFPRRLRPGLNLFNSLPATVQPAPSGFIQGWYTWWSEPVRFPRGLKRYLQQTTAMPPRLLPPPSVTGSMSASDTPDTFLAGGVSYNQVASADVGIIELVPRAASTGFVETTPQSANVGNISPIVAAQSGTVISSSFAANVSIKTV